MKEKCFKTLLLFLLSALQCLAQPNKDTSFHFYFGINGTKTELQQQKAFETFLRSVYIIKMIKGFADTTGPFALNRQLAQKRADHVYQLLPPGLKTGFDVNNKIAAGESSDLAELWQNRRVEVVASLSTEIIETNFVPRNDTILKLNPENILFIPDQPVLTQASLQYVKLLAQQLQSFKTGTFQIIGHVNYPSLLPPERLQDLYELSQKRAKTVYDLLINFGIPANRMTHKGVGNSDPVFPEPVTEEQKRRNMRVQVLVLQH